MFLNVRQNEKKNTEIFLYVSHQNFCFNNIEILLKQK